MDRIQTPYNFMLDSLSNIDGYKEFYDFLKKRLNVNNNWIVEIKSLFEINKKNHPLEKICSHLKSEPEGIFKIQDNYGIIEASYIEYLFNQNYETNKTINIVKNILDPFRKKIFGKFENYLILIILKNRPTEIELIKVKTFLTDFFMENHNTLCLKDRFGILEIYPTNFLPSVNMQGTEIILSLSKAGTVIQATNVNLNKKIISLIKSKRNQHKIKYKNFTKVYYLFINCPTYRLDEINNGLIQRKLHNDEILVLNAVTLAKNVLEENKKIFGSQRDFFDFSNSYYKSYQSDNRKYTIIPFGFC